MATGKDIQDGIEPYLTTVIVENGTQKRINITGALARIAFALINVANAIERK